MFRVALLVVAFSDKDTTTRNCGNSSVVTFPQQQLIRQILLRRLNSNHRRRCRRRNQSPAPSWHSIHA